MGVSKGYQPNIFRAISGSLFSTAGNWSRGYVPTGSDVADIRDNCTIDISRTLGTLVVRPGFTASINTGLTLNISQSINVLGHLSCSGTPTINILGQKNNINSLSPGISTFNYSSPLNQAAAGALYYNLATYKARGGPKVSLSGNLIVSGNLYVGPGDADGLSLGSFGPFDLGLYNLTVFGTSSIDATLNKSGFGYITFEGPLIFGPTQNNQNQGINLSGNPIVEFKRGVTYFSGYGTTYGGVFNTGEGIWKFSTNNQDIRIANFSRNFSADILISGPITASYTNGFNTYILKSINGDHPSSSFVNAGTLLLAGSNITPMVTGTFDHLTYTGSTIGYVANLNQTLPYNTYANLYIDGIGTKALSGSNTTIRKALYVGNIGTGESIIYTTFNVSSSNLIVSGTTTIDGKFSKTGPGNMLFMGTYYQNTGLGNNRQGTFDFSGNPTIEFQNGFETGNAYGIRDNAFNTGTGSWIFSTNNQNFNIWALGGGVNTQFITAPVIVSGSITVKYGNTTGNAKGSGIYFMNRIDGTTASSLFINSGSLYIASAAAASASFVTGALDLSYIGNTVGFIGDYTATIPSRFNTFYSLYVGGTGTKTLGTSSYISGALNVNGTFDIGSQNLTVSGASFVNSTTSQIIKSGPGKITFIGQLTYNGSSFPSSFIDFSGGNPTVELNRGISTVNTNVFNSGTGSWYFLSSSQKIEANAGGSSTLNFYGPMIIGSGVTLTIDSYGPININRQTIVLNNAAGINGTDSTSTLISYGTIIVSASAAIMTTGSFTASFATGSTINYNFSGSLKLPYTSYANLIVSTGSVTLTGSTSVTGSLTVGGGTIFDLQANNLFISGTTTLSANTNPVYPFQKTQSGSIIFGGSVFFGGPGGTAYIADFSIGNPDLEFRNSISASNFGGAVFKQGSGSVYFTTNNQGIFNSGGSAGFIFSGSIKIGSGITVTLRGVGAGLTSLETVREIDGTDANSRFIIGTVATGAPTVYYNSPLEPMRTGSMDVSSSAAATFIYNSGSQNVKGGTYRNLTFLNGLKTLQGNVSVLGTFSTGSGATSGSINLNGFTLTNP